MKKQKKSSKKFLFREGEKKCSVNNSGLEVWIYDDASKENLKKSGALNFSSIDVSDAYRQASKKGLLVGYSLIQDDEVSVVVIVGDQLTEKELSRAYWLDPQKAYLNLQSGKLCIESNDACRIGETTPYEKGAFVNVEPGEYTFTLYRIDYEAFRREEKEWNGPSEVIVLTPGGSPKDAPEEILPFVEKRDLSFINSYSINSDQTEALVWFDDGWDTFTLNLDRKAVEQLGIKYGDYLSVNLPGLSLNMTVVYGADWATASKMPPPEGDLPEEYGYTALFSLQDWNGYEMLFSRRVRAKKEIPDRFITRWLKAKVKRLEVKPKEIAPVIKGGEILATSKRAYRETNIVECDKYDPGFLSTVLSDLFPSLEEKEDVTIVDAISTADKAMKSVGFLPVGDVVYEEAGVLGSVNCNCRLYAGADAFGVIRLTDGSFELMFISELTDKSWVVSGVIDVLEHQIRKGGDHSKIKLNSVDEKLATVFKSHLKMLKPASPKAIPNTLPHLVEKMEEFLQDALN